ncbi:MAG TPA: replication initiator [Humibacter sp.]|nr:replication initiator [Humibacter sp.]
MTAPSPLGAVDNEIVEQIIRRASSWSFDEWWGKVITSGRCARPIRLTCITPDGAVTVLVRCKDRRAAVCPSCSALYAADTWHLVHAGLAGSDDIAETVGLHPVVFATLTAPSFGAVHSTRLDASGSAQICHPVETIPAAPGHEHLCLVLHDRSDELLGQPVCPACYDYVGHALTTWHAPELWHRFTIELRRLVRAHTSGDVRVSFVKVMEMQARAIPHYHAIVRLDAATASPMVEPPDTDLTATELGMLVTRAAGRAHLPAFDLDGTARELVFGSQIDVQPLTRDSNPETTAAARHIAGYLAKYVTKSTTDLGIAPRRIPLAGVELLDVSEHVRTLLRTLVALAETVPDYAGMLDWLHTLGYRGHTTSKSRRYSTTMGALRDKRTQHERPELSGETSEDVIWDFAGSGHKNAGDRYLAVSAAIKHHEALWAARQLGDISSPILLQRKA